MKLKTKLLLMAAFLMLIVPLMLTGHASAVVYNPDGAVLNGTTGLWELPDLTAIEGCYDGTTTINPAATRFDCRNVAVSSLTTASTCAATGVTPAGWNATASVARWSGCSEGGYSVNSSDPATDCVLAGGGTTNVFTRCNRAPQGTDCTSLPGYTFVSAGSDAASYTCKTTGMTVPQCTAFAATTGLGYNVLGSAGVSGATVTCSIYMADATGCTALGGTMSTANTDETRGFCGGNWVFKAGTVGDWGSSVRNNCTKCHNPAYMDGATPSPAGAVAKYVNASHKNASRKIVPGKSLANVYLGTDGNEYFGIFPYVPAGAVQTNSTVSPNYNIRRIDWVNGKIEDTTNAGPGWVGLKNLPTGVYTEWYWEFGYYGEDPERGVYNAGVGSNLKPSAKQQACFACHGTNYEGSATLDVTKEPAKSFPGIHWNGTATYTAGSRPGVVNFIGAMTDRTTNVKTTTTYGKWDEYGVVCSRCHNSAGGSHTSGGTGAANPTTAYTVNAVCGQCHVRASSSDYSVTAGTGVLTVRAQVGTGHPNYHATDFLNSPHARFTGNYSQITDSTKYNSAFMTTYNGCVGCHNPHGSVRESLIELTEGTSAAPADGIETECVDCHATTQASTPAITSINHPIGTSTPDDTYNACVTCHMPSGRHLFRITTDANYTTTQPTAFSAKADGTFTEAVWIDMKSACGQCHNGSVAEAPELTNAQLAQAAAGMHGGELTTNCTACHTVFTKLPSKHPSGTGTPTACTSCHTIPHSGAVNTDTLCGQCHGGSAGPSATSNGAPYISKSFLAVYAEDMHSNVVTPTASMDIDVSSYTVSLTDTSTDDKEFPANAVKVKWGDGTSSTGDAGSDFAHTYGAAGKYQIVYIVKDSDGLKSITYTNVYIPERFSIVVNLSPALSSKATFILKKNGVVKSEGTGKTSYTFTKLKPGTYQVKIKKLGYAFDGDAVTEGNQNPLTVVVGASDQTVTFTHTP
jgi:hypothetical protein